MNSKIFENYNKGMEFLNNISTNNISRDQASDSFGNEELDSPLLLRNQKRQPIISKDKGTILF